jgi:aminobenzoyl-glutamate transport protein
MSGLVIILSGILSFLHVQTDYQTVNPITNELTTNVVEVESLFSLSGLKYIVTNAVSDFVSFAPLSMLLITLIGIGILEKSGFMRTALTLVTRKMSKNFVTFLVILVSMMFSLFGDIGFVIMLPISALLFKYGKRNPIGGIIASFAAMSFGYGVNIFLSSVDSSLLTLTANAAKLLNSNHVIGNFFALIIMLTVLISLSIIFTRITEKRIMPSLPKYEFSEEDESYIITNKDLRGLVIAILVAIVYLLIVIYNIIPNLPLSGGLLDHSGVRYIDMIFGDNSLFNKGFVFIITLWFFLIGLSYGLVTKSIRSNKDLTKALSHSLDGIGSVIVLIFFASLFISIFKKTNIGIVITAALTKVLTLMDFTGIGLIIIFLLIVIISNIFTSSSLIKWSIMSGIAVPTFMNASLSPEFVQVIFSAGDSITNGVTPLFAYFVIYIAFLEKYSQNDTITIRKGIRYMIPYSVSTFVVWFIVLIGWYIAGIPLGIGSMPGITFN